MKLTSARSCSLALAAAAWAAALAGCGRAEAPATGRAGVRVDASALQASQIASMLLTVSADPAAGGRTFPAIAADLSDDGSGAHLSWTGWVQGIPAGPRRVFSVQAFDSARRAIYSGSSQADVTAGGTANLYLLLQGQGDGSFRDALPLIDSLSASTDRVAIDAAQSLPVALSFSARSPASGALTYAWATSCAGSSFDRPTGAVDPDRGNTVHWTPPPAAPPDGACTVTLKVIDAFQGAVTAWLVIRTETGGAGPVLVYPDTWPVITGIVANETFTKDATGRIAAVDYDLVATATDADLDDLKYAWSVAGAGCQTPGSGYTATTPAQTTPVLALAWGPGQIASSAVHFHSTDLTTPCILRLDVTDYWRNGIVPPGSGLPVARGGDTVGVVNGTLPQEFAIAPQITKVYMPGPPQDPQDAGSATFSVGPDVTVALGVETFDPTPSFDFPGTPFTYSWSQSGGAFVAGSLTQVTTSPGKTTNRWQAAHVFQPGSFVKVTVTSAQGLSASYTWRFRPANACDGTAATAGIACDTGLGLCAPHGQCTAAGACADPGAVVCADAGPCWEAGACLPSTGKCVYSTLAAGTACNADGDGCTRDDACDGAGRCVPGAAVVCDAPADAQCQLKAGTCVSTGSNRHLCQYASLSDGTPCNADSDGCTPGDSCRGGVCSAGARVVCAQTDNPCQAGAGTCASTGANTFICRYPNLPDGASCASAGACIAGQSCQSGVCSGGAPACPPALSCEPGPPVACRPTAVAIVSTRELPLQGPVGLAIDTAGASYLAAAIYSLQPVAFDGHPVASGGDADIFLAKYDAAGIAQWAVSYGDGAAANPQAASGAAVTSDGTLAVIGNFSGRVAIGPSTLASAAQAGFLAGFRTADGSGRFAGKLDLGAAGALKAVAANPGDASGSGNRIAVCGFAHGAAPADLLGPSAAAPAGKDIVVGVFSSDGSRLWAAQFSSPGAADEECDALAVDDAGDVWAAGTLSGASLSFGGATAGLAGPGSASGSVGWLAKFDGATGAALAAAAFGGSGAQVVPTGLAVDASGHAVLGGRFSGDATFGATRLSSAGQADGWVARFGAGQTAEWAVRLGGPGSDAVEGVAVDSFGDVIAIGVFSGGTTGAATLTAASPLEADAFLLKLTGATGATDFGSAAGSASPATGDAIAVNRWSAHPDQIAFAGGRGSAAALPRAGGGAPLAGSAGASQAPARPEASAGDEAVAVNHWPRLRALVATPEAVEAGQPLALRASAYDADGDPLAWRWTSDCDGVFAPGAGQQISFTPALQHTGPCTLAARVEDGRGGVAAATVTVLVSTARRLLAAP